MSGNDVLGLISSLMGAFPLSDLERKTAPITINMIDTENTVVIHCELPGVEKSDINIDVCGTDLTVTADKKKPAIVPVANGHTFYEIRYGKFSTKVVLPVAVSDVETMSSSLKDGVLTITINKNLENKNKFSLKVN